MIYDDALVDDDGFFQIAPLHPNVVADRQRLLKADKLPKGGMLCVKISLSGDFSRGKAYYPNTWTLLNRNNVFMGEFDDSIPYHIVTDMELLWLFGEVAWFSTALRSDGQKYSCKAFKVVYPRGAELTRDLIGHYYPLATKYLKDKDYNLITHYESYSYDMVESDYALCVFLQHFRVVVEGLHRWEVPFNAFAI